MRCCTQHRHDGKTVHVYINGKLKLTLKNYKMATISLEVQDNQTDLDTLKQQVASAEAALSAALAAIQSFQISFTASVTPPPAPAA